MSRQQTGAASAPVYFILHNGVVSFVSSSLFDVSGNLPSSIQGRAALDLVHPDDREQLLQYFVPGWEGRLEVNVRVQQADGSWQWRRAEGVRTIDAEGHASAVVTLTKVNERGGKP
jgi:PAS domain S-box-containing protein